MACAFSTPATVSIIRPTETCVSASAWRRRRPAAVRRRPSGCRAAGAAGVQRAPGVVDGFDQRHQHRGRAGVQRLRDGGVGVVGAAGDDGALAGRGDGGLDRAPTRGRSHDGGCACAANSAMGALPRASQTRSMAVLPARIGLRKETAWKALLFRAARSELWRSLFVLNSGFRMFFRIGMAGAKSNLSWPICLIARVNEHFDAYSVRISGIRAWCVPIR